MQSHPEQPGNVYIAIAYGLSAPMYEYAIKSFTPLITQFDKSAIPDHHGVGGRT